MQKFSAALVLAAFILTPVLAHAELKTPIDALIEKLIQKGILTPDEADNLKGQVAYDTATINEAAAKKAVPDWVQNFKVGGDFRARIQTDRRESGVPNAQGERFRNRIRARLNFETKVNDKAKVVIGIATDGGTDNCDFPRLVARRKI